MKCIKIRSMEDFERYLYDFKIMFAYHSNKIENEEISYRDTKDVFEKETLTGFTGNIKTVLEIQNQKESYEFLKPYILDKKQITIDFIKKLHYILTKGTYDDIRYHQKKERPGEFKKHDYIVGINEVGSTPEDVEEHLYFVLQEINSYTGNSYFKVGVYLHAMLENIHPFADGNGRVGRTLMNYYFMIHDIAPVVIYNEYKQIYYEALAAFDADDSSIEPLNRFIEEQQRITWDKKEVQRDTKKNGLQYVRSDDDAAK